ncbi:MAG: radical SAM family heme chaperone HemW [Muribaculaceae bacterium]|nr:radical SAM family heme chaperone HemW [Muribaculaceae bacterium]
MNSGIYIHIPFCRNKCIYCDFFSGGDRKADWHSLVNALKNEYRARRGELSIPVDTLYIGGGTPSLMPADCLREMLDSFKKEIPWYYGNVEITIEVNPDDVDEDACRVWKEAGINRVSMGVQSFNDVELKTIGRRHDSKTAIDSFNILRKFFSNISIDLMFGLPGQTPESWRNTVRVAVELKPDHISAYTLMFEEGTPISILRDGGRMTFPDDEDNAAMWQYLSDSLQKHGYRQYEISNYSLPGYESRHNGKYWNQSPYLGLGPSAHSYDGKNVRRFNPGDLNGYMEYYANGVIESAGDFYDEEELNESELSEEFILTRMRTAEGLPVDEYRSRFGEEAYMRLMRNYDREVKSGFVGMKEGSIVLTREGIMVADSVIVSLSM